MKSSVEKVIQTYLETKSIRKTAELTGYSKSGVEYLLKTHSVAAFPRNRRGGENSSRKAILELEPSDPRRLVRDPNYMRELYIDKKMSTPKIAKLLGVSTATIMTGLKQCGIILRTKSEALKRKPERLIQEKKIGVRKKEKSTIGVGIKKLTNEIVDQRLLDGNRPVKRIGNYVKAQEKIEWECLNDGCDHKWLAKPCSILSGTECPKCGGTLRYDNYTIDQKLDGRSIKRIDDYINGRTSIRFQCLVIKYGHIWEAVPESILAGSGCPKCNTPGLNEKLMHQLLSVNDINYHFQFPIRNIDNNAPHYRLDAYVPNIKLAIEYNGRQHYVPTGFGSSNIGIQDSFIRQQARDEYVRNFCKLHQIELIEIDGREYYGITLKEYMKKELIPYIVSNLEKNNDNS